MCQGSLHISCSSRDQKLTHGCFALDNARSQTGCWGFSVPLSASTWEWNTHLPADTCKTCSFSLLKHRSLSELLSKELKRCLGLKPDVLHFYTMKYPLCVTFSIVICLQKLSGHLLTHKLPRLRRLSAQIFLSSHIREASLDSKAV